MRLQASVAQARNELIAGEPVQVLACVTEAVPVAHGKRRREGGGFLLHDKWVRRRRRSCDGTKHHQTKQRYPQMCFEHNAPACHRGRVFGPIVFALVTILPSELTSRWH